MKPVLCLVSVFSFLTLSAQKRIGLEINPEFNSNSISFNYQVLGNEEKGILYGFGINMSHRDGSTPSGIPKYYHAPIPVDPVAIEYNETLPNVIYHYKSYYNSVTTSTICAGIGKYIEFRGDKGIKVMVHGRFGMANSLLSMRYSGGKQYLFSKRKETVFAMYSIVPELQFTSGFSPKYAWTFGVRTPYSRSLQTEKYNPVNKGETMNGFDFELILGITKSVGKCN